MPCGNAKKSGIEKLIIDLDKIKPELSSIVNKRMDEFKKNKNRFSELCFCILTANYSAKGGIKIQNTIGDFSILSEKDLSEKLKKLGHRFPNTRARYISEAINKKNEIEHINLIQKSNAKRKWLADNIMGLGYKESSHFLRNIGYFDVAIIDKHILNLLDDYKIIKKPKTITKTRYFEIEKILEQIAKMEKMSLGELDLYLWYMKTGEVLK